MSDCRISCELCCGCAVATFISSSESNSWLWWENKNVIKCLMAFNSRSRLLSHENNCIKIYLRFMWRPMKQIDHFVTQSIRAIFDTPLVTMCCHLSDNNICLMLSWDKHKNFDILLVKTSINQNILADDAVQNWIVKMYLTQARVESSTNFNCLILSCLRRKIYSELVIIITWYFLSTLPLSVARSSEWRDVYNCSNGAFGKCFEYRLNSAQSVPSM